MDGDLSVNKVIFMKRETFQDKNSSHLISSGPWGMVHFWNVFNGPKVVGQFPIVSEIRTKF